MRYVASPLVTSPTRRIAVALSAIVATALPMTALTAVSADAASYHYNNCTQLHKHYKHGVGKSSAKDRVRGKTKPVTTFKRSTKIYKAAIKWNSDLDRDRDGVACEKR